MFPVIVLKIFTPSWRFSTTLLDFSKLMSSPIIKELYIFQTCYMKPILTSNLKTEKIKQRIKYFGKNLIILKISLLGYLKHFMIRCRHYPPVTTLPDLTVVEKKKKVSYPDLFRLAQESCLDQQLCWSLFMKDSLCARRDCLVHQRMNANGFLLPYDLFS